ncbi:MAG: hypothetical protein JXA81_11530 [Sedimentisphaerales bacterium]|nr:hypothetical protein [Sedimentisphaerales bacterium]
MNEFIEKNRPLLRSYCIGARIIGWLLIIMALIVAVVKPLYGFQVDNKFRLFMIYSFYQQLALSFVLLGLIVLGLAQFVRYLHESEYQPGLILRHGDKILYLYALALIVGPVLHYFFQMKVFGYAHIYSLLLSFLAVLLPAVARALIFVGMAKVLKRMVPMIEESKTLV